MLNSNLEQVLKYAFIQNLKPANIGIGNLGKMQKMLKRY